MQYHHTFRINS